MGVNNLVLRKGKLWKMCKGCNEMYPAKTKRRGFCNKCFPTREGWLDELADKIKKDKSFTTE